MPLGIVAQLWQLGRVMLDAESSARAAAHWPSVVLEHAAFAAYLEALPGAPKLWDADALSELYLACACSRGDAAAMAHFDASYLTIVPQALAHMRLSADVIDEVRQQVRHKLLVALPGQLPKLCRYAGHGKLRGLLQVIAVRCALSILRKEQHFVPDGGEQLMNMPSPEHDPELAFLKRRYRAEFKTAFEEAVANLTSRDRNFLRLHLFGGLTVEQVGKVYGVHRATATRWLAKLRGQLLKDTQGVLRKRLNVNAEEFDSLMQLIQSRLDVSMQRVLQTAAPHQPEKT